MHEVGAGVVHGLLKLFRSLESCHSALQTSAISVKNIVFPTERVGEASDPETLSNEYYTTLSLKTWHGTFDRRDATARLVSVHLGEVGVHIPSPYQSDVPSHVSLAALVCQHHP